MRSKDALRVLAEITAYQWGMVTSAQASTHGVTRLDLSRLTTDGLLERLLHGVYKTTGTPGDGLDRLRAAWLSTNPKRLAHERRTTDPDAVVFAGASAARIHGIGDLWDEHFDFITPVRRQSQRGEVHYRKRVLDPRDVTTVDGLPVLSVAATIADLVEVVGDLSLVADALRDAWRMNGLDVARLTELLCPMADRGGFAKGGARGADSADRARWCWIGRRAWLTSSPTPRPVASRTPSRTQRGRPLPKTRRSM